MFYNTQGLADSAYAEKVEITQGCSHSDMCNVFEDNSIVTTCISWPCKLEYYGDTVTQVTVSLYPLQCLFTCIKTCLV